ncbi:UNVERIFIED_CONTAM: transposase [Paenibacillus sp. PvR008]
MLPKQQSFILSPYLELYNILIPQEHVLRKMNELVDFHFVYEELHSVYCHDNGRTAVDPVRMFKYLLLKCMFDLSDVDLVERTKTDLAFKFFLHMAPEEDVIDPSLLTKFRKLRLGGTHLLDLLIKKTVEIAVAQGVLRSTFVIVDATHTQARYSQKSPQEVLRTRAKDLRKAMYAQDESMKNVRCGDTRKCGFLVVCHKLQLFCLYFFPSNDL